MRWSDFLPVAWTLSAAFVCLLPTALRAAEPANQLTNPTIWADVPDTALLRVGDTYYMSSTTAHLSPHVPIMKSRDLVNWTLIGYAGGRLDDGDALNLTHGQNAYSGGSWASSLRLHDGVYYCTTFSHNTNKTYVYTTRDIEKGPWTAASFSPSLHDHTLVFDDGHVYMIWHGGEIRIKELTADASGIKPGGLDQVIIPDASKVAGEPVGLPAEGSQMLQHDGRFYLFNIAWPKGGMRTVVCHRADKITGPYEGRIVFHDKGIAQGSLIDTPDGRWFAALFQDHGAVGRVPWLVPMTWEDGWPVIGVDGRAPETVAGLPPADRSLPGLVASDTFDRKPGDAALPLAWQWNHNPDDANWSLAARPGWLRLSGGRVEPDLRQSRNMLTQRTFGPQCSATTIVDAANLRDGDVGGLAAFQKNFGYVGVRADGGGRSVVMVSAENGTPAELARVPLAGTTVHLRVDCDFRNGADSATFFYSPDGRQWTPIGRPLHMKYTLPQFIGYRFGLFHQTTKIAGGTADFDEYRVSDKIEADR